MLGCLLELGTVFHCAICLFSLILSVVLIHNISRKWQWWQGGWGTAQPVKCYFLSCKHGDLPLQLWRDGDRCLLGLTGHSSPVELQASETPCLSQRRWTVTSFGRCHLRLSSWLHTHAYTCACTLVPKCTLNTCMYMKIHSGTCIYRIPAHRPSLCSHTCGIQLPYSCLLVAAST